MAKKTKKARVIMGKTRRAKQPAVLGPPAGTSTLTPPPVTLKLDLACGQRAADGFEGVDLHAPNAQHKVDLSSYPWPWADSSVAELRCSHYIEHIMAGYVTNDGTPCLEGHPEAKDALMKFFDECYRILAPGAWMEVICPSVRSERAFWDPTHRRFIAQITFMYTNAEWRKANGLDHYRVDCDYNGSVNFTTNADIAAKHPEAQAQPVNNFWNVIHDWIAKLQAVKPNRVTGK